ncbi:hypothetical protein ALT785_580165 [Alteromonas infernus]
MTHYLWEPKTLSSNRQKGANHKIKKRNITSIKTFSLILERDYLWHTHSVRFRQRQP